MGDEREEQGMGDVRDMRDVADVIDVRAVRDMTRYEQTNVKKILNFFFFSNEPFPNSQFFWLYALLKTKSIEYLLYLLSCIDIRFKMQPTYRCHIGSYYFLHSSMKVVFYTFTSTPGVVRIHFLTNPTGCPKKNASFVQF